MSPRKETGRPGDGFLMEQNFHTDRGRYRLVFSRKHGSVRMSKYLEGQLVERQNLGRMTAKKEEPE